MGRRKPATSSKPASATNTGSLTATGGDIDVLRPWLLAAITALYVSRALVPSEGVSWVGDGQPWVMLWLVVAAMLLLQAVGRGRLFVRLEWLDYAVLALIVWHTLAAIFAIRVASPRPTVNMLWEWVGMGASFVCVRQLVRTEKETRAIVAVMIALAVGLSVLAYYQYFVDFPAERARYAADPDAALRQTGEWYAPNSAERTRFEDRLESREPIATFALANSLAGFLVPWLVITIALAAGVAGWRCGMLAVVMAGCLLLTKSRSGYVATLAGAAGLYLLSPQARQVFTRARVLGAVVITAGLIVAAIAVRGLDAPVLTEAGKSLGYRWQYWQATWGMICDRPWLGCGPGDFQDVYTAYKLPESSEEIQDPHNFLLEIWATAGTPAVLAMLGILGLFALRFRRTSGKEAVMPRADGVGARADGMVIQNPGRAAWFIAGGGLAGLLVANVMGAMVGLTFTFDRVLLVGVAGVATWLILAGWVNRQHLRPEWLAIGVAAQCVHHLAAGGIGYPGVAGSFWLLLALAANRTSVPERNADRRVQLQHNTGVWQRLQPLLGLVAVCVAAGGCYLTAYGPVLRCRAATLRARAAESDEANKSDPEQELYAATLADALSADACTLLAEYELMLWKEKPDDERFRRFAGAADVMLRLEPLKSSALQQVGGWYSGVYAITHDQKDIKLAIGYLQRAVERYPTNAALNAELAEACQTAGKADDAARFAAEALRLDAATPHLDKRLSEKQRKRMREIAR